MLLIQGPTNIFILDEMPALGGKTLRVDLYVQSNKGRIRLEEQFEIPCSWADGRGVIALDGIVRILFIVPPSLLESALG